VIQRPSPQVMIQVVRDTDPELNLIGKTIDEAEFEIDKFLDRAFVSRLSEVTIIHGFGTGRLKSFVSRFLSSHPQVESYRVEGGVTRAQLKT
jgi:DNA mismatch repair protein MutS2